MTTGATVGLKAHTILFIDDDPYVSSSYVGLLESAGFDVTYVRTVKKAIRVAQERRNFDVVVIDIMMPPGSFFDQMETMGGYRTGIPLAREMIELQPTALLIALTHRREADVEAWFTMQPNYAYCYKGDFPPEVFPAIVKNKLLGVFDMPNVFIVHGHDHQTMLELKNYLQNSLGLPEPTILAEQPSRGMTLIEKFEYYAEGSDLVFALFTPDDFANPSTGPNRARQNVLFEYGYFLGMIGRRAGRVFLLHKKGVELPSDLHGLVYVDISSGIQAAGEQLRRELRGLIPEKPRGRAV